jgi:preprotein translocase subunit SecY
MIANSAFLAAVTTFLIVSWVAGELSYLSPYKTALFRIHGTHIGLATVLIFLNLFGVFYGIARVLFVRDTGRKLKHLDRQLSTADGVIDELRHELKP